MKEEVYDFFAASLQDGYIGNLINIVERAGGAKALFEMDEDQMARRLNVSDRMVKHIVTVREEGDFERAYERMLEDGIIFVNHKDEKYPTRLRNIPSRPYALFVKGSLPEENRKSVAIIGSRECSEYGRVMAEYFADRLARRNVDIISGMAWGIDGIAQNAALIAGGRSYGVLGCGVDVVYPKKNYALYEKLCQKKSGVISEYSPNTKAQSRMFPPRNRIIAGLSDIVIVVEARQKSGTLITVDMANEQGKTIMVVPGRLTDPLSLGCLNLIGEGAIPIINIEGILNELGISDLNNYGRERNIFNKADRISEEDVLESDEKKILSTLSLDPLTAEDISQRLNLGIQETLALISKAEQKGLIKEISMGLFVANMMIL